ncbi:MAG: class I SAM-dependent methyltransferase [Alphaproteobacteria bacterium]|nr:class I SAM-dependent methyltransferase [Alphaproteobacteria bacterium]
MSRLDSAIRRLQAQRACLEVAAELVRDLPGPILELGLGNGRSFDHLRELMPEREIFAFDRQLTAHPACVPDEKHLIIGDFAETLPNALARIGAPAALVHADTGTGEAERNARLAAWLGPRIVALMAPGGVILSDQELVGIAAKSLPLPDGVRPGRYFFYRVATA